MFTPHNHNTERDISVDISKNQKDRNVVYHLEKNDLGKKAIRMCGLGNRLCSTYAKYSRMLTQSITSRNVYII